MDTELVAYTDEAGTPAITYSIPTSPSSGLEPCLANPNFDQTAKFHINKWVQRLGVPELHGTELGLQKIERIAHGMEVFIRRHGVRFIFTRLEKEILCVTKFVDTFFDSE